MENAEVEVALEELENRLERLRALYEQYFMGIERIEPAIPRKDVDRRIYVLRREKIRNTAKRFKLQTIISRYNTFQQYWQRICREIEAGTYKRHVIRAERIAPGKMLTIAARKRLGRAALEAAQPDSVAPEAAAPPSVQPAAPVAAAPVAPTPTAPGVPRPRTPSVTPAAPPKPPARPAKPNAPLEPARPKFESLDTMDLDFMNDWDPSAAASKTKRAPEVPARPFGRALTERLGASPPPPAVATLPLRAKPGVQPMPPPPPRAASTAANEPAATAERPVVAPRPPPPPPAAPANTGVRAVAPARPAPAPPPARPAPPRAPAAAPGFTSSVPLRAAPGANPARPPPPAPKPAAAAPTKLPPLVLPKPSGPSPSAVAAPAPIVAKPVASPPRASLPAKPPAAATALAAPIAKPPAPKPAAPAAAPVADERVRELHARLVEAKRQTKDAATVSMEGLAKSMKATEAKLREQHKNRKIDFDVVIKDGKAVLKPIVR